MQFWFWMPSCTIPWLLVGPWLTGPGSLEFKLLVPPLWKIFSNHFLFLISRTHKHYGILVDNHRTNLYWWHRPKLLSTLDFDKQFPPWFESCSEISTLQKSASAPNFYLYFGVAVTPCILRPNFPFWGANIYTGLQKFPPDSRNSSLRKNTEQKYTTGFAKFVTCTKSEGVHTRL